MGNIYAYMCKEELVSRIMMPRYCGDVLLRVFGSGNGDCVNKPSRSVLVGFGNRRKAALQSYSRVGYLPLGGTFLRDKCNPLLHSIYMYIYGYIYHM